MPPALPWLLGAVAIGFAAYYALMWQLARILHARHGDRHTFESLFLRLRGQRLGPRPDWYLRQNADSVLMHDLRRMQRWAWAAGALLLVILYVVFSTVIGHFRQQG